MCISVLAVFFFFVVVFPYKNFRHTTHALKARVQIGVARSARGERLTVQFFKDVSVAVTKSPKLFIVYARGFVTPNPAWRNGKLWISQRNTLSIYTHWWCLVLEGGSSSSLNENVHFILLLFWVTDKRLEHTWVRTMYL